MKSKLLLYITFLVILFPFIINAFWGLGYPNGFVLESSIFSGNYGSFIQAFLRDKSVYFSGNSTMYLLTYIPVYSFFFLIEAIFRYKITAYFIGIMILLLLSIKGFLYSFSQFLEKDQEMTPYLEKILLLLCILFYTCLSNFLLFPSTIFFFLPVLVFPVQLMLSLQFVQKNSYLKLLLLMLVTLLISINLTVAIINIIFINFFVFLYIYKKDVLHISKKNIYYYLNLAFLPTLLLIIIPVILNSMSLDSSFSETFEVLREDFYSINSSIYTIITQTSFWGLFGGFNGDLYYNFSVFYANRPIQILAFIPYILILFLLLQYKNIPGQYSRRILLILLGIVVIFFFMLGLHNPIYTFLYNNLPGFQVFRNITKFAPFLQFTVIFLLFYLIINKPQLQDGYKKLITLGIILSLGYNIPYWTYPKYFFEKRVIPNIPIDHLEAANYINTQSDQSDKILLLPVVYNLELYNWDNQEYNVQGNLYDVLISPGLRHYRYGELGIGPTRLQKAFKSQLIYNDSNSRKLDIDYSTFGDFLQRQQFNQVVITKDIISEYQEVKQIIPELQKLGYQTVYENESVSILKNSENKAPLVSGGKDKSFTRHNARFFTINMRNLSKDTTLSFFEYFHTGWGIYIEKIGKTSDSEFSFWKKESIFSDSHSLTSENFNSWIISPEKIKKNFSKEYYNENSDGSIDIQLSLYFKPQLYFILGFHFLWIITGMIGFLFLFLGIRKRKKH